MSAQRLLRTPVGILRVTANEQGITAIERVSRASTAPRAKASARATRHVDTAVRQLREYFAGTRRHFTVSLHLDGTPFQQHAWAEMQKIAYGDTISYAQQAARMKKPRAVRAVGSANGANPIPIIVPCHRVVASNGGLGGYALGLTMKRRLLAIESAV
jgi:methylated-DNA-[protein]-cysteine S-methyltransferase